MRDIRGGTVPKTHPQNTDGDLLGFDESAGKKARDFRNKLG
jgi:hypothetical protein